MMWMRTLKESLKHLFSLVKAKKKNFKNLHFRKSVLNLKLHSRERRIKIAYISDCLKWC